MEWGKCLWGDGSRVGVRVCEVMGYREGEGFVG